MFSLLGNYSDTKEYYFNTSFYNAELNYSFQLRDWIRLGSGLGYYDNRGWNKQIGLKQQLSATIMKRMNIDLDLSYKKAIHVIRPELANQFFMTSSIRYQL